MSDNELDNIITEISKEHHIGLDRNDPVVILYTMNKILYEKSHKAQEDLLREFQGHMELAISQAEDASEEKFNNMVAASKKASEQLIENAGSQVISMAKDEMNTIMNDARDSIKKQANKALIASYVSLGGSVLVLITVLVVLLISG